MIDELENFFILNIRKSSSFYGGAWEFVVKIVFFKIINTKIDILLMNLIIDI
jgi:hypothetical protein